jgi:glycosyltransferase involved in cell wall biosynthesis
VVVFESMAYGTPVIGARRGGIPEMIEEGVNGLLFDPDRPDELKAAMNRLAQDTPFREAASRAARRSAAYFLDMDRFLSGYEELYCELCSRKTR